LRIESEALASGRWQPDPASERRRRSLLPRGAALDWTGLSASPDYVQAVDLLP